MGREIDEGRDGTRDSRARGETASPGERGVGRSESISTDGGRRLFDRIFIALSDRRRRFALYFLERVEPTTISEIARHVAAWETDAPPPEVDEERVRRVVVALYHDHLPRLDDLRLVEYDHRSGDVRFRDCPEALLAVIDSCRPRELPNPRFDTE